MFTIGQRSDVADILVVITDGMFDNLNSTWLEARNTRARNINIIGVSTLFCVLFLLLLLLPLLASFQQLRLRLPSLPNV